MIVIHHNPDCGTSRNVLAFILKSGAEPVVVDFLKEGWTRPQLRATKSPAAELGLLDKRISDGALLDAMLDHPILVNRPIVCSPKGVRLCRPSAAVFDLLDQLPAGPLFKEDGHMVIDENGDCP